MYASIAMLFGTDYPRIETSNVPLTLQPTYFEQTDGGLLLSVKAQPGASRDAVLGWHNGMLRVAVTQIAEKGKANKRLREVRAKGLGLKQSQVTLVAGATSVEKKFLLTEVDPAKFAERLSRGN